MLGISEFLRAPDGDRRMLVIRHLTEAGALSASGFASLLGAEGDRDLKTIGRTFGYLRDHKLIDWARDARGKVVANACKVTDQGLALLAKSQINVAIARPAVQKPRGAEPAPVFAKAPVLVIDAPVVSPQPVADALPETTTVPETSGATAVQSGTPLRKSAPRLIQPDGKIRRATLIEILAAKKRGIAFGSEPMTMAEFNGEAKPSTTETALPPQHVAPATNARREPPKRARVAPGARPAAPRRPTELLHDLDALFRRYLRAPHTSEEFASSAKIPLAEARDILQRGVSDGKLAAPDLHGRYVLRSRIVTEQPAAPQVEILTREQLISRGIELSAEDRMAATPHRHAGPPKPVQQPIDAAAIFGKPDVGMIVNMPQTDGDFLFALSTTLSKLRITSGGVLSFGDKKYLQTAIERFLGLCGLDVIPDAGCTAQSHAIAAGIEPPVAKRILDLAALLGFIEAGKDDEVYAVRASLKGKPAGEVIRFAIARLDSLRTVGASRRKLGQANWRSGSVAPRAMHRN